MGLQDNQECCFFYHGSSGVANGGGCTKDYLDSVSGVLSTVLGANGAPKYIGEPSGITNSIDASARKVTINDATLEAAAAAGLIAYHNSGYASGFLELTSLGTTAIFGDCDVWIGEQDYSVYGLDGSDSELSVDDASEFTLNDNAVLYDYFDGSWQTYQVIAIDTLNDRITIDDNGYIATNGNNGDIAPELPTGETVILGGASNDMQTVLDLSDAQYKSQWIFVGSGLDPSSPLDIDQTYQAGDEDHNTMLNIVGYVSAAYDSLPSGWGYFSESDSDGAYYKTANEWLKDSSSISLREVSTDTQNASGASVFAIGAVSNLSIRTMGFEFVNTNQNSNNAIVSNLSGPSFGFASFRHSIYAGNKVGDVQSFYSSTANNACEAIDCSALGPDASHRPQPLKIESAGPDDNMGPHAEISYCACKYLFNFYSKYNAIVVRNSIIVNSRYGGISGSYASIAYENNILYNEAGSNISEGFIFAFGIAGRFVARNNIIVLDTRAAAWKGVIRALSGGAAQMDNNCFYEINGDAITPIVDRTGEPNWDGTEDLNGYGQGNITADPLFMDAANYDFRLKPQSPCIALGVRDIFGNETNAGADQRMILGAEVKNVL